jgi:hypothetical protein
MFSYLFCPCHQPSHSQQKQNLNEVENLYFHHSHLRGPRPNPSSVIIAATHAPLLQVQAANSTNTHLTQSNLSFRQHLSGTRADSSGTQNSAIPPSRCPNEGLQRSASALADSPPVIYPPEVTSLLPREQSQDPDPPPTPVSPRSGTGRLLPPNPFSLQSPAPSSPFSPTKTTKSKSKHKAKPKPSHLPPISSPSFTPQAYQHNIDSPLSDTYTTAAAAGLYHSEFSNKSRGDSGRGNGDPSGGRTGSGRKGSGYSYPNTSLTYDSFWSSHSSSSSNTVVGSISRGGGEVA